MKKARSAGEIFSEIDADKDGSITRAKGVTGEESECVSRWLDDERLETRQALLRDDGGSGGGRPDDANADVFVTVRSLADGGASLLEDCSVVRGGVVVEGAAARRILRRI